MISEPEEPESMQEAVETPTPRGPVKGILHIPQAEGTMDVIGSQDKEFLVLDAGRVGLTASPVAKNELWPRIHDWLEPRSR